MSLEKLTFESDDKLQLSEFAKNLELFMEAERPFVSGSLVISLNAQFGSGKTFFLQMWKTFLEERRTKDVTVPIPIILNTWESDHASDPILAIISSLSAELVKHGIAPPTVDKVRDAAKDLAWLTLGMASSFVANATGIDAIAATELADRKKSKRKEKKIDLLAAFEQRKDAVEQLRTSLKETFAANHCRAIVMIDELDRCRPDYAVNFLEAIKHVFAVPEVAFVLAVDKSQLRASVCALFGNDINFDEYYRKFAHRNIKLPKATEETITPLVKHYWSILISNEKFRPKNRTFAVLNDTTLITAQETVLALNLSPRQLHEMFRMLGHILATAKDRQGDLPWGFLVASIVMSALAVGSTKLYEDIGKNRATFSSIEEVLRQLFSHQDHGEWWIKLLSNGKAFKSSSQEKLFSEIRSAGYLSKIIDSAAFKNQIAEMGQAWGFRNNAPPFTRVYSLLENIRRFESS